MYFQVFLLFSLCLCETSDQQLEAEKFLEQLETEDTDPKVRFKKLVEKYNFKDEQKIYRRTFQKFFAEFQFERSFEECRELQYQHNMQSRHLKLSPENKNIAVLMNDLDMFMGLIKDSFLSLEKIQKIIFQKNFKKFLIDITQQKLKGQKKHLERETLRKFGDDFMSEVIQYDL